MIGIYQITNTRNGKCYIGSSVNLRRRYREHWRDLENNRHANRYLQSAWNKDGPCSFEFKILLETSSNQLLELEQQYIDRLKPVYNMCKFARNRLGLPCPFKGRQHSLFSKLKMQGPRSKLGVDRINPLTGEVKEYDSGSATQVDGFQKQHVYACCNGTAKIHKGYYWSYRNA